MKEIYLLVVLSKIMWFLSTSIIAGKFMETLKKKKGKYEAPVWMALSGDFTGRVVYDR